MSKINAITNTNLSSNYWISDYPRGINGDDIREDDFSTYKDRLIKDYTYPDIDQEKYKNICDFFNGIQKQQKQKKQTARTPSPAVREDMEASEDVNPALAEMINGL